MIRLIKDFLIRKTALRAFNSSSLDLHKRYVDLLAKLLRDEGLSRDLSEAQQLASNLWIGGGTKEYYVDLIAKQIKDEGLVRGLSRSQEILSNIMSREIEELRIKGLGNTNGRFRSLKDSLTQRQDQINITTSSSPIR